MKYLWLLWSNLTRRKLRTGMTIAAIVAAFLLFGLLIAVKRAFTAGVEIAGQDRLVVQHKMSFIMSMPISYLQRIAAIDGVAAVTHATWMGGTYQEPNNVIGTFPVDPETYLAVYPEIVIPDGQKKAWMADRKGAAVGRVIAAHYGWKVGDVIPIRSNIYRKKDGGDTWDLDVSAIYDTSEQGFDLNSILLHYEYYNEAISYGRDMAGWFTVKVADPARAADIAKAIDVEFENSPTETKTSTEKAFAQSFAQQIGDIGAIVIAVVSAVFFSMLLITAMTMGQAVRERTRELAVLKTLGFGNLQVMALVLAESLLLAVVGGVIGLGLAYLFVNGAGDSLRRYIDANLPVSSLGWGLSFALLLGLLAGAFPAAQALRLRIVDALRRA